MPILDVIIQWECECLLYSTLQGVICQSHSTQVNKIHDHKFRKKVTNTELESKNKSAINWNENVGSLLRSTIEKEARYRMSRAY